MPRVVNKEEFEQNGGKYVGFQRLDKDDAEYVLLPDKVISTALHLLVDSGRELVSDSTTIFKELLAHGVAKGYENKDGNGGIRKRYLKRVKPNEHLVEMLVISKDAMERAIRKFLEEERWHVLLATNSAECCLLRHSRRTLFGVITSISSCGNVLQLE